MKKILILFVISLFVFAGCDNDVPDYPNIELTEVSAVGGSGMYRLSVYMNNSGSEGDIRLEITGVEMGYPPEERKVIDEIFPVPSTTDYMVEYDIEGPSFGRFHFTLYEWTEKGFRKVETIEDVKTY